MAETDLVVLLPALEDLVSATRRGEDLAPRRRTACKNFPCIGEKTMVYEICEGRDEVTTDTTIYWGVVPGKRQPAKLPNEAVKSLKTKRSKKATLQALRAKPITYRNQWSYKPCRVLFPREAVMS